MLPVTVVVIVIVPCWSQADQRATLSGQQRPRSYMAIVCVLQSHVTGPSVTAHACGIAHANNPPNSIKHLVVVVH